MSERKLPVVDELDASSEEPSCSPRVYVSNEEVALMAAMRALRERADEIRRSMPVADAASRAVMQAELDALRRQRADLARRREAAYRRKMVMLGHLPPEALEE